MATSFCQRTMSYLPVPSRTMSLRSRRAEHPTVSLGLPQLDRYHDRAERALTKTIAAYARLDGAVDTNRWKSMRSCQGIRLLRGRYLTSEGQTPLLCVGALRGSFDDVMEGLYCDNTEDMLLMNAIKCRRLAESAVLYAVQKKSPLEPCAFTGIKWATIKLSVASNRDLCYFDKMGMVRQTSGRRMAYHVLQSVELPEYPHKTLHKRVQASLCYVFEELEDDLVGVYMQGEMDPAALSYFSTSAVADVLLAVSNVLDCTRAKKLAHMMSTAHLEVSSRKSCFICKCSSSFFASLASCAGCSKHVCKKCRFKEYVLARDTTSGSLMRAEFCRVCISKVKLLSLDQIRIEASGFSVAELGSAVPNGTFCKIEEETEDVKVDVQGSDRSLTSFVRKISAQMQELSTRGDNRASSLSSMGKTSAGEGGDNESEDEDVLNCSRLKSGKFDKDAVDLPCRSRRSSTTSTASSSNGHDEDDPERFKASLFVKLQQVASQAEETLVFVREQSLVAQSVRQRSRRHTQSSEGSGYAGQ
jgi:hypothetical protein